MARVYLGIGGNMGNTQGYFLQALRRLTECGVRVKRVSDFIRTKPYGGVKQTDFLNAVIEADTEYTPLDLLRTLKSLEYDLGRRESVRWGPRCIDLDILLYEDICLESDELTIPHKDMQNREFVMKPLEQLGVRVEN